MRSLPFLIKGFFFIIVFFLLVTVARKSPTPVYAYYTCNQACTASSQCAPGLTCFNNRCRKPACPNRINCVCPVATATPTPTVTPTPIPLAWVKLKDASFSSPRGLDNSIPPAPLIAYDGDDDSTQRFFIMSSAPGPAGITSASSINLGTATTSTNDWKTPTYSKQTILTASTFLEYVRSRKSYQTIRDLNSINADGIYVWDSSGNNPIPSFTSVPAKFDQFNVVLIVSGASSPVIVDTAVFKPANSKSLAILATTLNFTATTTEADGLFVTDNVDVGTTVNQGLKIVGNLIVNSPFTNTRKWATPGRPSLFIVFKATPYLKLLPFLSVDKYDWRQLQ